MTGTPDYPRSAPEPDEPLTVVGLEEICQECGDDLACEGYWYCSDCLERLSEDERTRNDPVSD